VALRQIEQGTDPEGLGRWCWQLYRGKKNSLLQVITAYRPNFKNEVQVQAVYIQQRKRFLKLGQLNRELQQVILDDLASLIHEWKRNGEHIVLMMDANQEVRTGYIKQFLDNTDMRDVVMSMHGLDAPNQLTVSLPLERLNASRLDTQPLATESKANAQITDAYGWTFAFTWSLGTVCPQSRKPPSAV
jgi:hypothetical protein